MGARRSPCHEFFSSVLADVGLWIRFLRKEAMSQVALLLAVLGWGRQGQFPWAFGTDR